MTIPFINDEACLMQLLQEPFAKIIVLANGQMTLSTRDCRLDILMVYELVHHRRLRITSPVTIELARR